MLLVFMPKVNASSANTIAELRKEIEALKAKKQAQGNKKAQTQSEINTTTNKLNNTKNEITEGRNQIETARLEIKKLDKEIEDGTENIKSLMKSKHETVNFFHILFFQFHKSTNLAASSITIARCICHPFNIFF